MPVHRLPEPGDPQRQGGEHRGHRLRTPRAPRPARRGRRDRRPPLPPRGTEGAGTWCVRQHQAVVRAPHDTRAAVVPVEDAHGKAAVLDACGETIAMAAPRRAANGS
ncbi:hypothetical protein LT493_32190 [Streptomyces tricolor]|nr:hypothetical protein [Streptomyces tricolor]